MLFIHGSLAMGGIETFILRMAKQRAAENKETVIILLSVEKRSDAGLVAEARKYATLLFMPDLTVLPAAIVRFFPFHLSLLLPIKAGLRVQLKNVTHVHVTCGICAYFYAHIARYLPENVKFSIGVYHSLEFIWGGSNLPFFERKNRTLFFDKLSKSSIIFFNESMVPLYEKASGQSFQDVNLFPLGVVESSDLAPLSGQHVISDTLKLVSVGRLVPFKTYNLHMIDVVAQLHQLGVSVVYDIYGDGPLEAVMQKKIAEQGLQGVVNLKGLLNYKLFADVISEYDIFVGSGTAIVQAAGLGVSAIVGIENTDTADTYGFLADLDGFSYNEDGLYKKKPIVEVLKHYLSISVADRAELSKRHVAKACEFSMAQCVSNFDHIPHHNLEPETILGKHPFILKLCYSKSFFAASLKARLNKSSLSEQVRVQSE